jgi:Na+-driven multidrug efflux pump
MLFPRAILGLYITDTELVNYGSSIFRILMSTFFLQSFILLSTTLFQSVGKGGIASFLLIARQVIIFIPLIIILPIFMGLTGIWISLPISDALIAVLTFILIWREFKQINVFSESIA